jgi:quercetin dioxygenase-like cupin family protein
MAIDTRRVITGHDDNGKATVAYDDNVGARVLQFEGVQDAVVWSTDGYPLDLSGSEDMGVRKLERTPPPNGSIFRVVEFAPGNPADLHVTHSIDYAVILSGEIDLELEEGREVHLKQGDVVVQRETVHGWRNRGTAPCAIAFILVDKGRA